MVDLLVDTDVFVDHLRGAARMRPRGHRLFYSVITRAELFAGKGADEAVLSALLAPFTEVPLDRAVAEEAGRIRRQTGILLPDAIIAATAQARSMALVTRNRRHFAGIRGLRVRATL